MFIHSQELLSVHDTVRARTYETPIPAFDPNFHPSTHYSRHRKGGETRTVGLHKSANESLVSAWGSMYVGCTPRRRCSGAKSSNSLITIEVEGKLVMSVMTQQILPVLFYVCMAM